MKKLIFWAALCAEALVSCATPATTRLRSLAELEGRYQCLLDWLVADCPDGRNAESLLRDRPDLREAGRHLRRMARLAGTGGAEYRRLREAIVVLLDRAYAREAGWNRRTETAQTDHHVTQTSASGGR